MKKQFIITSVLIALIGLIIINSEHAKAGAVAGWGLCENVIVPSLLPVLILTNIIISSDCSVVLEKTIGRLLSKLFGVSPECGAAIFFGLVAGYPSGAVLCDNLYSRGVIDRDTACRIMKYNFSGGIAFTIMVVGRAYYGDVKTGLLLYFSTVLSSLIIGIITGIYANDKPIEKGYISRLPLVDAMTQSVNISIKSILNMCAYIILFSAVNGIISLPAYVNPLLEITNGVCNASPKLPLDFCAFFLTFGGLCIHLQIIGIINHFGMRYSEFVISRLAGAIISFTELKIFCLINPQYASVFSTISTSAQVELTQVNTGLSIIMVLGCAVLILDIEGKKLKLI